MGESRLGYIPELDGIRALAITLVVMVHAGVSWLPGGFFGVDVFFVLSGYLITRLLVAEYQRTDSIALGRFYVRRLRRLYPALLFLLVVHIAVSPWAMPGVPTDKVLLDAGIAAAYLSDYTREFGITPSSLSHLWSLSVEEHFYLLWPLAMLGIMRLPRQRAIAWLIGIFVVATAWRLHNIATFEIPDTLYIRFDTHASGLALGCLIGYANLKLSKLWGWFGLAALIGCALLFRVEDRNVYLYGFTLVEMASAALVLGAPHVFGRFAWMGRLSYGLYLWHVPIISYLRLNGYGIAETLIIGGLGGLAMAALSYYTVEAYFRRSSHKPVLDPAVEPKIVIASVGAATDRHVGSV